MDTAGLLLLVLSFPAMGLLLFALTTVEKWLDGPGHKCASPTSADESLRDELTLTRPPPRRPAGTPSSTGPGTGHRLALAHPQTGRLGPVDPPIDVTPVPALDGGSSSPWADRVAHPSDQPAG